MNTKSDSFRSLTLWAPLIYNGFVSRAGVGCGAMLGTAIRHGQCHLLRTGMVRCRMQRLVVCSFSTLRDSTVHLLDGTQLPSSQLGDLSQQNSLVWGHGGLTPALRVPAGCTRMSPCVLDKSPVVHCPWPHPSATQLAVDPHMVGRTPTILSRCRFRSRAALEHHQEQLREL